MTIIAYSSDITNTLTSSTNNSLLEASFWCRTYVLVGYFNKWDGYVIHNNVGDRNNTK